MDAMRRMFIPSLLLGICCLAMANGFTVAAERTLDIIPVKERVPAPEFSLEKLEGGSNTLAEQQGKLILLNFWATWCMPCREEMPGLELLWQKYRAQGLVILAVAVETGSQQRVRNFQQKLQLSFPILLDPDDRAGSAYRVSDLPASYLIDRQGRILSRIVGSLDWVDPGIDQLIQQLLKKNC